MLKIDSHLHFWPLSSEDDTGLNLPNNFVPEAITPYLKQFNIQGAVVVPATSTLAQTYYLLEMAKKHSFIYGVIGWVDMLKPNVSDVIAQFAQNPSFRGIRLNLKDNPNLDWILRKKGSPCFDSLSSLNLTFDALVDSSHLPYLIQLSERYPQLKMVINHGGSPTVQEKHLEPWASNMKILANHSNVFCKLTGFMPDVTPLLDAVIPYLDHLIHCFGPERIMWGSDAPRLPLSEYGEWYQLAERYINQWGAAAYKFVFGDTAQRFYNLKLT